jgi:hypothetical protein
MFKVYLKALVTYLNNDFTYYMLIKLQVYPNVKYYETLKTILNTYKLHILNTNLVNH